MAQIALLVTIAFIVYALRRDFRERGRSDPGSWISFLWIALGASRSINYWVYPSQAVAFNQRLAWEQQSIDLIQNNPLERNLMIVLIGLGVIALIRRHGRFRLRFEDNGWLFAFYAFSLVSISWSDYQGVALKRWIRFIGDMVAILLILTDADPEKMTDQIIRRVAIILLPLSVLFIRYYGQLGRIYTTYGTQMWVGVTGHKNQLGMLCAYTGVALVWRSLKKWPKVDPLDVVLLALVGYLLAGARSQTSIIVFLLGVVLLVVQSRIKGDVRKFNRGVVTALIAVFVVQSLAVTLLNKSLAPAFFASAGRDSSFTGRVPLWQELVKMGARSPFVGSGFASFWLDTNRVMEVWRRVDWTPTTAHNGYLDTFLDLGIIGLLGLFLLIVQTYKNIMRTSREKPDFGKLKIVFFTMVLFHNFTETSLGKPNSLLWLLFLLSSIMVSPGATVRANPALGEDAAKDLARQEPLQPPLLG